MLPRLMGNRSANAVPNGSITENGCGKFNDITSPVLQEIASLGVSHVWYTGVIEHATATDYSKYGIPPFTKSIVKGQAGSPYAISDYYDVDPDLAEDVPDRMKEFENLIKRTHDAGLKVIMDFVPNHVAREYRSDAKPAGTPDFGEGDRKDWFFARDNNFYYFPGEQFRIDGEPAPGYSENPARATGNDCFTPAPGKYDWYETVKLNYGIDYSDGSRHFDPIPDTWIKMLDILLYWASKGVDGFRCDMAHMVPVEFWSWAIGKVKEQYPHLIFIAEIYDVSLYRDFIHRGRFDYLYDKVTLYDTLRGIECCGVRADALTGCWQTVDDIRGNMLNFLENHDEQRFASTQYASDPMRVVPSLVVASTISTSPVMVYAGQELGERAADAEGFSGLDGRTTIFDYWAVPALRSWMAHILDGKRLPSEMRKVRQLYKRILNIAASEPAVAEGGMHDLMYANGCSAGVDPAKHYLYLRGDGKQLLLIAVNFSDTEADMEVVIPGHAFEHLSIPVGKAGFKSLLHPRNASVPAELRPDGTVNIKVPPHGAEILKLIGRKN